MRIAIVKLSALGDIVHAMVVLQLIREAFPESRVDWIVEEGFAAVLEHNPHIHTICPINFKSIKSNKRKIFSEIAKLKKYALNRYDIVIDLQGLLKSAIASRIVGPTSGFDRKSVREGVASLFYKNSFSVPYENNVIERNVDLVAYALGINRSDFSLEEKTPFLYCSSEDKVSVAPLFDRKQKNIVSMLGSSWESKVYPKEQFAEVIQSLEGNHILVWGSDAEHESAEYIAERTSATVAPRMSLNELKAVVAGADLVIGADSGPTHFAWALNRPSITIFGPTPSWRNTLTTSINRVIDCNKTIDPNRLDRNDFCICEIPPQSIAAIANELLGDQQ